MCVCVCVCVCVRACELTVETNISARKHLIFGELQVFELLERTKAWQNADLVPENCQPLQALEPVCVCDSQSECACVCLFVCVRVRAPGTRRGWAGSSSYWTRH